MPIAEERLGVRPPYSFTGRDAPPLDELRRQAKAHEEAGDLPAAAVLWRRILAADAADATAKAALPRVLTALGERLR
jgi:predicted TPR repeat methyltransferase